MRNRSSNNPVLLGSGCNILGWRSCCSPFRTVLGGMLSPELEEIDGIIAQHKDTSGFQPEMNR